MVNFNSLFRKKETDGRLGFGLGALFRSKFGQSQTVEQLLFDLLDYSSRSQVEVFIYNLVDLLSGEFLAVASVGEHADGERLGNADCIGNLPNG